jgi:hypothetical protein
MKQTTSNTYTPKPRWEKAQSPNYVDLQTLESNRETFSFYFNTLMTVKTEFMALFPELSYERDYTKEPVQDIPAAVHCFMTKTFYWYLACDECDTFIIHYHFSNCPFEAQIRKLLIPFADSPFTTLLRLQPDLATTFKRTSRLEDNKFFKAW